MNESEAQQIRQLLVLATLLPDGTWQAGLPGRSWSMTGASEQKVRDRAVAHAIEIGEDADEVVRDAPRRVIELEEDDPRVGWVWRFAPQTEQFGDGTWRAWFASGGWTVSGSTEQDAIEKANAEWFRRRDDPDEQARRLALMRRHLVEPQPGVQNTPSSVLESAWSDPNPMRAVGDIIEGLGAPG
ncbi:hypothetical protein [Mycobacterium sp. 1274761.0]|uniref:hypothetical protein n=1 Tax=Mycobacterium sp. 1274761.0 TaxID=1834077 RepID=UPI0007FE5F95|nr:hypothetical protein [Mycobacterium sp. 1274761.0]OBK73525.1 hypothetical protein A5651_13905 [Mycobacterium sp. 1274761.0]